MATSPHLVRHLEVGTAPAARFARVRAASVALIVGLVPEDTVVQTMADVSPTKWHLAHTTWFFEQFVLAPYVKNYRRFHDGYDYLFNSYYNLVGPMHRRPERGFLSRPTLAEVLAYRAHVDEAVTGLLGVRGEGDEIATRVILGCHHEQQHQELIATDIKHVLAQNPLVPAWRELPLSGTAEPASLGWSEFNGGLIEIGYAAEDFCFDNECPRHRVYLEPYALADRLVTNAEYRAFIADSGYTRPELWLSDGWTQVQTEDWRRPLYWMEDSTQAYTVGGMRALDPAEPVCHLSYYEADAYARWSGARLPTEAEWERAAVGIPVAGNLADAGRFHPARASGNSPAQFFGDVWEWTASAYLPYPGYRAPMGAIGEYNGKFMSGQMVLRGGSCVTPDDHVRATYRNFFYPHQRWQFSGLRLARDAA
ncbi:MAG: ergothioneine biosynthesis protein EgtB [Gammaproteobacteria bacterium]